MNAQNKLVLDFFLTELVEECPKRVIHEVLSYNKNKHGFWDVVVDMESQFLETKILHTQITLPYPMSEYLKLSENEQRKWRTSSWFPS